MSFVPAPQQATAASPPSNNGLTLTSITNATAGGSNSAAMAVVATSTDQPVSDYDLQFRLRTFDVFWVEKDALMYKDGIAKVRKFCSIIYFLYFPISPLLFF
jgi:ATP-dependent RNA helicase DDX60